jgi:hypothetical protein
MMTERNPLFVRRLSRSGASTFSRVKTTGPPEVSRSVNRYERSARIVRRARSSSDPPEAGSVAGSRNETGIEPARTVSRLGRPWRTGA